MSFRYVIRGRHVLRRAGIAAAGAVAAVVAGVLAAVPGAAQLTASWTGWLNGGLEAYADTAGQWNSGGSPVIVALPGGRALWLVPDSYAGPVRTDGTVNPFRARSTPDALLLTQGSGPEFRVLRTASVRVPRGAVPAGGIVSGNAVLAVYDVFAASGLPSGTDIVRMPLASLTRPSTFTTSAGPSAPVRWESMLGSSVCPPVTGLARCTYIYGTRPGRRLAEAVTGSLADRWWFDTRSGWVRSSGKTLAPSQLADPLGATVDGASVYKVSDGTYVALSGSATQVTAYYASSPTLEQATPATLFAAPSVPGVPGALTSGFRVEPAYSSGPHVVMGYSVDSVDHDQSCLNYAPYYDVAAYQPEFYSFTLPSSPEAVVTGTLPAPRVRTFARSPVTGERWGTGPCSGLTPVPAPAGFRARYAGDGRVDLTWTDPGGLYQYDIRLTDAGEPGAGWREFGYPVWDSPCPGRPGAGDCFTDTASASFLAPGHTYRYEISAWNWTGAGDGGFARSGQATVTLPAKITAVTSGLCVNGPVLGSCVPGQGWRYTQAGRDGKVTEYALSRRGGRCLDPSGNAVALGPCAGAAREWEFRIIDGVLDFNLYNKATGRCLAVDGNSQSPGSRLVQAPCSPSPDATWHSSFAS